MRGLTYCEGYFPECIPTLPIWDGTTWHESTYAEPLYEGEPGWDDPEAEPRTITLRVPSASAEALQPVIYEGGPWIPIPFHVAMDWRWRWSVPEFEPDITFSLEGSTSLAGDFELSGTLTADDGETYDDPPLPTNAHRLLPCAARSHDRAYTREWAIPEDDFPSGFSGSISVNHARWRPLAMARDAEGVLYVRIDDLVEGTFFGPLVGFVYLSQDGVATRDPDPPYPSRIGSVGAGAVEVVGPDNAVFCTVPVRCDWDSSGLTSLAAAFSGTLKLQGFRWHDYGGLYDPETGERISA